MKGTVLTNEGALRGVCARDLPLVDALVIEDETLPVNPEPPTTPLEEVLAPFKAEVVAEALR